MDWTTSSSCPWLALKSSVNSSVAAATVLAGQSTGMEDNIKMDLGRPHVDRTCPGSCRVAGFCAVSVVLLSLM